MTAAQTQPAPKTQSAPKVKKKSDPKDIPGDLELLVRVLKLASLVNTPMKESVCDPARLGLPDLRVMMALSEEARLAGHELVEITGLPAMAVSRAISALKNRGWVVNARDLENKRRRPVRLSAKGRSAFVRLEPKIDDVAGTLFATLKKRQRRSLAKTSDAIVEEIAYWLNNQNPPA